MNGVDPVLMALKPVAGQHGNADLGKTSPPAVRLEIGQGRWLARPQVGPREAADAPRWVRVDPDFLAEPIVTARAIERLLRTAALRVIGPAVIGASE